MKLQSVASGLHGGVFLGGKSLTPKGVSYSRVARSRGNLLSYAKRQILQNEGRGAGVMEKRAGVVYLEGYGLVDLGLIHKTLIRRPRRVGWI